MKIVVEGPDCSGKSTLAQALHFRLGNYKYVHNSLFQGKHVQRNISGQISHFSDDLFHSHLDLLRLNENIIIDRHWPSELVYGHIFRNKFEYDIKKMRRHCKIYRPIYIGCLPSYETVLKKFEERKDTEDFDYVDRVYEMYARIFKLMPEFKIFNYEKEPILNFIKRELNVN